MSGKQNTCSTMEVCRERNSHNSSPNKLHRLCIVYIGILNNIHKAENKKKKKDERLIMYFKVFKYTGMFKKRVLDVI